VTIGCKESPEIRYAVDLNVAEGGRNLAVWSKEAAPRVAAIISAVEACLSGLSPAGLDNFSVNQIGELTPAAWATRN
jgi:hypothetical protein